MFYRLAEERDIDPICNLIKAAVRRMERQQIFQWDDLYPTKEDFLDDIQKRQLFIGLLEHDIVVVYAVKEMPDEGYQSGKWQYTECEYRIIHRLCVNPAYQNRGVATQTLIHIEEELHKANVKAVRLDVFSGNPAALALYLSRGYEKVGVVDGRKGKFYLMKKSL